MTIIIGTIEEGLVYAIMALGVYITYKILDFPDLSVDGTFPLGAALTAVMIANGFPPASALIPTFLLGALAGCVTGLIHVACRVRDLLSGIIVMTALYSVNMRITGMRANLPILSRATIFENEFLKTRVPEALRPYATVIILAAIVLLCKVLLDLFMKTRSGYLLRAAGSNDTLVTSLAVNKGLVKILGLALANGFAALAGGILCQKQSSFEISMGTGAIVIGLASVILGTQLFWRFSAVKATLAVIAGSILYKACVALAISARFIRATDMKLVTAVILLIILAAGKLLRKPAPAGRSGGVPGLSPEKGGKKL